MFKISQLAALSKIAKGAPEESDLWAVDIWPRYARACDGAVALTIIDCEGEPTSSPGEGMLVGNHLLEKARRSAPDECVKGQEIKPLTKLQPLDSKHAGLSWLTGEALALETKSADATYPDIERLPPRRTPVVSFRLSLRRLRRLLAAIEATGIADEASDGTVAVAYFGEGETVLVRAGHAGSAFVAEGMLMPVKLTDNRGGDELAWWTNPVAIPEGLAHGGEIVPGGPQKRVRKPKPAPASEDEAEEVELTPVEEAIGKLGDMGGVSVKVNGGEFVEVPTTEHIKRVKKGRGRGRQPE